MIGILKFTKEHNSAKGIMVIVLCTSSENALYLSQVLSKYLKGFQTYRLKRAGLHLGGCNLQKGIIP